MGGLTVLGRPATVLLSTMTMLEWSILRAAATTRIGPDGT